jgi:Protein of unknown function (DUF3095)
MVLVAILSNSMILNDLFLMEHNQFYADLPLIENFVDISNANNYCEMPEDWLVVVTDVENSTKMINEGRYKEVNMLGAASIISILNIERTFALPFIFGGDGAIICIPPGYLERAREALLGIKLMALKEFKLHLRVGIVPLRDINETQHVVMVGKYKASENYLQAVFIGGGIEYAEKCIKDRKKSAKYLLQLTENCKRTNLNGLECRWENIPSNKGEIISLLVKAVTPLIEKNGRIYKDVISKIKEIYGDEDESHPIREKCLNLSFDMRKLNYEIKLRSFKKNRMVKFFYRIYVKLSARVGTILMEGGFRTFYIDWGKYKPDLIANTDYRKFDDQLRYVISGNTNQRKDLKNYLEKRFKAGELVYGIRHAPSALITCLLFNYTGQHIHFIDGENGGYALAALDLKERLATLQKDKVPQKIFAKISSL